MIAVILVLEHFVRVHISVSTNDIEGDMDRDIYPGETYLGIDYLFPQ
jgi:hypothetical protein